MTEKTPAQKMRLKPGMTAAFLHAPAGIQDQIGSPSGISVVDHIDEADFVLVFADNQSDAEDRLLALQPHLRETTLAWLAYPKGSKKAGYDLNRDTIWAYGRTIGLDFVANVSLDQTWSAMRMRPAKRLA